MVQSIRFKGAGIINTTSAPTIPTSTSKKRETFTSIIAAIPELVDSSSKSASEIPSQSQTPTSGSSNRISIKSELSGPSRKLKPKRVITKTCDPTVAKRCKGKNRERWEKYWADKAEAAALEAEAQAAKDAELNSGLSGTWDNSQGPSSATHGQGVGQRPGNERITVYDSTSPESTPPSSLQGDVEVWIDDTPTTVVDKEKRKSVGESSGVGMEKRQRTEYQGSSSPLSPLPIRGSQSSSSTLNDSPLSLSTSSSSQTLNPDISINSIEPFTLLSTLIEHQKRATDSLTAYAADWATSANGKWMEVMKERESMAGRIKALEEEKKGWERERREANKVSKERDELMREVKRLKGRVANLEKGSGEWVTDQLSEAQI